MSKTNKIKVLYNDSDINIKENNRHPQGGITRFAYLFKGYFDKKENVTLVPFLFSPCNNDNDPIVHHRVSSSDQYAQVSYDRSIISNLNKNFLSTSEFKKKLTPILDRIQLFISEIKPDVIFLNGFGISNWMLMYVGHKLSIPVIIQHAGVWKFEIKLTLKNSHPNIRRTFYRLERDTIKYCSHHIFLTEASRDQFQKLHISKDTTKKLKEHSSVIPLSVDVKNTAKRKKVSENGKIEIGMVARWDNIKNHTAMLKLASSKFKPDGWHVQTVTKISNKKFDFVQRYIKKIDIVTPMSHEKIISFYKKMDVTILPSHFETFGGVVIESLLAGTPAIISEHVGLVSLYEKFGLQDHIIRTNISGKGLVETIDNIISNPDNYEKKYSRLRKYIRNNFNTEAVLSKYFKLFKKYSK